MGHDTMDIVEDEFQELRKDLKSITNLDRTIEAVNRLRQELAVLRMDKPNLPSNTLIILPDTQEIRLTRQEVTCIAPSVHRMEATLVVRCTWVMQPPKSLQKKHRRGGTAIRNSKARAAKPASKNRGASTT